MELTYAVSWFTHDYPALAQEVTSIDSFRL